MLRSRVFRRTLFSACTLAATLILPVSLHAQSLTPCALPATDGEINPSIAGTAAGHGEKPCEEAAAAGVLGQTPLCFAPGFFGMARSRVGQTPPLSIPEFSTGYPINLNPWFGPGPGDFPPLSTKIQQGTSPLIPTTGIYFESPHSLPERQTIGGVLDQVTGTPLLRHIDLELPFGGATYRFTRTYGELPAITMTENERAGSTAISGGPVRSHSESETFWDWCGQGWMIGENPIFLFDSSYWGIVTDEYHIAGVHATVDRRPTRCYFIPDAHRSIPFDQHFPEMDGPPVYVAPPHLDAKMWHEGGVWNHTEHRWVTPPQFVHVALHNGQVIYKIRLYHGAHLPPPLSAEQFAPHHRPGHAGGALPDHWPADGFGEDGFGVPAMGLVEEIRDPAGNRILLEHCVPTTYTNDVAATLDCIECQQTCQTFGQLRRARLVPAGSETASWTILYTHRNFRLCSPLFDLDDPSSFQPAAQNALLNVHVYQGEVSADSDCATIDYSKIDAWVEHYLHNGPHHSSLHHARMLDALDEAPVEEWRNIPSTWTHKITLRYLDPWWLCDESPLTPNRKFALKSLHTGLDNFNLAISPRLIAVKTDTRGKVIANDASAATISHEQSPQIEYSAYGYQVIKHCRSSPFQTAFLLSYWSPQTLASTADAHTKYARAYAIDPQLPECSLYQFAILTNPTINDILVHDRSLTVPQITDLPGSNRIDCSRAFHHVADLEFYHADLNDLSRETSLTPGADDSWSNAACYLRAPIDALHNILDATQHVIVRSSADASERTFFVHRFMQRPNDAVNPAPCIGCHTLNTEPFPGMGQTITYCNPPLRRAIFHYPFRYILTAASTDTPGQQEDHTHEPAKWITPSLGDPLWHVLVREKMRSWEPFSQDEAAADIPQDDKKDCVIHAYSLNCAGALLRQRVWNSCEPLDCAQPTPSITGFGEEFVYEEIDTNGMHPFMRLKERRSYGWSSPENTETSLLTRGLVHVFDYEHDFGPLAFLVSKEGIRSGADPNQPVFWTRQYLRNSINPFMVESDRVFVRPTIDMTAPAVETTYSYQFGSDDPSTPANDPPLLKRTTSRTGDAFNLNDTLNVPSALVAELFDDKGQLAAIANGDASALYVTAYDYDRDLIVRETVDVPSVIAGTLSIERVAPAGTHTPLSLQTAYSYRASDTNPWLTVLPNGTEIHVYEQTSDPAIPGRKERRTYTDVVVSGGVATTLSPVLVEKIEKEQTLAISHGALAWPGGIPPTLNLPIQDDTVVPHTDLITTIDIDRDPNGRPQALAVSGTDNSSALTARVMSDGFGNAIRTKAPDGTISRNVFDLRGRLTHVYRGTQDEHAVWWNRTGNSIDCSTEFDDNLMLIEKREYGEGIHDALQLVSIRNYRSKPTNQYRRIGCHDTPNDEDDIGFVTRIRYDWRMRPVVSQRFGEGAGTSEPPLTQSVTFLDHANRVRFVAEYGPDRPTDELDPITRAISADVPSAADLLSASLAPNERPLQLTENIYATRGDLVEVREYDVNDTSASTYTFTHTVPDYAGRPILVQDTNGGITRNKYDAIGRLLMTSIYAKDVELTRATFTYNLAGNTISHALTERVLADSDNELDSGNSVTSYTHNWYDTSNRLIVTVEYGAADSSGIYKSNTEPPRATVPPSRTGIPSDARMTESFYDRFGREWQTVYPSGSAIQNDYDGLGRVILVRELDAPNGNILRRTAYRYDDARRLWMIAAVRPEHGSTVVWDNPGDSLQITELLYSTLEAAPDDPGVQIEVPGAIVTNESGEEISRHAGWVARVKFPDAPCPCDINGNGSIEADDIFAFLDAWFQQNGLPSPPPPLSDWTADFNNDDVVNADDIFAFLDCWFAPPNGCGSEWENQAGDLQFKYLADGRLHSRTSIDGSTFTYAYDALDRLHAISATSSSPATALVVDALTSIVYEHDAASRLTRAIAHTTDTSNQPRLVSDSLFEYDGFGRLTAERSALGTTATSATPGITYEWSTASTAAGGIDRPNTSRLSAMTYGHTPSLPSGATAPATRSLSFSYGSTGSATDLLSRIAGMSDGRLSTLNADWTYSGFDSRIRERMGLDSGSDPVLEVNANAVVASSLARVTGWSAFKQRTTNTYTSRALTGASMYSAQHAFDRSGSRTKDEIAFAPTLSTTNSARSWAYAYDPLNRLVAADRGVWNSGSSGGIDFASSPTAGLGIQWNLDDLGNWVGDNAATPALAGRIERHGFDSLGLPRFETATTHRVNERNELSDHATALTDNDPPGGGGTPTANSSTAKVFYDRTGRLTYDGTSGHLYRYDHWGRLVEVRAAIGLSMNTDGSITGASPGDAPPGRLVAHYVYDALGRLVSRQTPHTGPPATTTPPTPDHYDIRQELYFYDGVRRVRDFASILERPTPLPATPPEPEAPWTGELGVPLEADAQRAALGLGEEADLPTPQLTREYIWSPAADGYIDELLAQVVWTWSNPTPTPPASPSATETVLFAIRNTNHNVVGLTDDEGEPAAWFGYTPYGELDFVQAGSSPHAALALASRVGHQGLFFDNLETPWAANQLTLRGNGAAHAGLYHNRNRSYLPSLGRFAQRDPNTSGIVTSDVEWWNGTKPSTWYPEIHVASLYGNGLSLHTPLLSSPTNHSDPAGLFIGGMVGMVGGMPESMDPYLDYNDEAMDAGMSMKDYIGIGLQAVAFDQYLDSFWAGDWSQPDDLYRGSASWSMGSGIWEGQESTGAFRSSPAMASAWTDTIKGAMSREAKGMGVYLILNEANEVIYAGRSVNLQKRMAQSQKIQGGARAIGIAVDSRATMRAMEDLMIRYHQQIGQAGKNMINGVSKLNDNRGDYYKSLKAFMSKLK